jgi:glucuronate isomerase
MKPFLNDDFLLQTETAQYLYHEHASHQPIIDYHCHLSPKDIADDRQFKTITELWLEGDHYKWRAMRTNGIKEHYVTGKASDWEKFEQWAATVPHTMRNPLYHWTHLELKRYFGIDKILGPDTAREIYDQCNEMLQSKEYSVRNLLRRMKVEVVCTTDDPTDTLKDHQKLADSNFEVKVLPTFRPDKILAVDDPKTFNEYINKLARVTKMEISKLDELLVAIYKQFGYFHLMGCKLSDHGLERIYVADYTKEEIEKIFLKIRKKKPLDEIEKLKYRAALLEHLGKMYHEQNWIQQYHLGALRNNNSRMKHALGPDTGWDSIGDFEQGRSLAKFLDNLDKDNKLTKTILYNLNPRDNEVFATMIGNFNDGSTPGKIQWGSGWWFLDQKDGMEKQLNALSNMGLLSRFVGMLTDSRSFLSYPRHEYFRRILCNLLGNDVHHGELPNDRKWLGQMVENISYINACWYFEF